MLPPGAVFCLRPVSALDYWGILKSLAGEVYSALVVDLVALYCYGIAYVEDVSHLLNALVGDPGHVQEPVLAREHL